MKNIHDDQSSLDHWIYDARDLAQNLETDVFAQCYALIEVNASIALVVLPSYIRLDLHP